MGSPPFSWIDRRARPWRNDLLRAVAMGNLLVLGVVLRVVVRFRIVFFRSRQARLRRRLGIEPDTPIVRYGPEVEASIEAFAARHPEARFAFTSGSTSRPKKIAFTPARLRSIHLGSLSVAARLAASRRITRAGLFILSSLQKDDSLTSLILEVDDRGPALAEGLLVPTKYLSHPAVVDLLDAWGAAAVRLWLLVLADPGLLYSTNPSTMAVFLNRIHEEWTSSSALIRAFATEPDSFDPAVRRIAGRLAATGWAGRFERIAVADRPLPIEALLPRLAGYCAWDGGYVRPFLETVGRHLPPDRYAFIPMYSMSTETVETLNIFDGPVVRFLTLAPRVLYEFLPLGAEETPENLIPAERLEPGREYLLVASDPYGLSRYQTDDIFHCRARVGAVPDLLFRRRQGLAFSFTGEKLTGEQLTETYERLRREFEVLRGIQMTTIPTRPDGDLPGYRFVLAPPGDLLPEGTATEAILERFEAILAAINHEFAGKRESERLAPTRLAIVPYDDLAARLDPKTVVAEGQKRNWESQFKLLPLYSRRWEEVG